MCPFEWAKAFDDDEYRALKEAVVRRKTPAGKSKRAKAILLSNQGFTTLEIAERLGCNERTALKRITTRSSNTASPAQKRSRAKVDRTCCFL